MWLLGQSNDSNVRLQIPSVIVESKSCKTTSIENGDTFIAFVSDQRVANILIDILCNNQTVNRQFGKAEVRWSHKEQDIIQHIGKGIAHLALVKENLMSAFATEQTHGYQVVGFYRNYSAYLISLKDKPIIDKQYLWGKKLGLLDYPSSRSGHVIPKQMLKELGLSDQSLNITYANSHAELRALLAAGQVDIISSYWQAEDKLNFSENYITPIQANVSGSKWYLKLETQNTDLTCAIQNTLRSLTQQMDSEYFSNLIIPDSCQPEEVKAKSQ